MKRAMFMATVLILCAPLQGHAAECGWLGRKAGICELSEQLLQSAKEVNEAIDTAAEAIPGERYLRMIDAINDPTTPPEEKKRYQQLATNIFAISPDTQYEMNIAFGLPDGKNIEASFFYAPSGDKSAIEAWCKDRITYQTRKVSNAIKPQPTPEQRRLQIAQKLGEAIELLGDQVNDVRHTTRGFAGFDGTKQAPATEYTLGPKSALSLDLVAPNTGFIKGHFSEAQLERRDQRNQASEKIHEAMDLFFGNPGVAVSGSGFTRAYKPYAQPPYLIVTIPRSDFDGLGDEFVVSAVVYQKDANGKITDKTLDSMWPIQLKKSHFEANDPVSCGNSEVSILWSGAPLLRDTILSAELIQKIRQTQGLLEDLEKEQRRLDE